MSINVRSKRLQGAGEQGFVSLLTCIMLSLLIIVVTLSLVTIESLQLQKSDDSEQALRAYYASEAGVEDAAAQVLSGSVPGDETCNQNKVFENDASGQAGWTCQTIKFDGTPAGKLSQADQAVTIDPGTGGGYNSVLLEWNTNGNAAGNYDVPGALPDAATYASTYAAPPLELTVVQYQTTFNTNNMCTVYSAPNCTVTVQNALMVPRGPGATGQVDYNAGKAGGFSGHGPYDANCGALGRPLTAAWQGYLNGQTNADYNCYAVIMKFTGGSNFLFRLRSRYLPSDYQMIFKTAADGNGSKVTNLPTGSVTIDVTARAGQSYRRVISQLPLNRGASGGLNYVMYSDTDICKNFDVLNNAAPASGSCPSFP